MKQVDITRDGKVIVDGERYGKWEYPCYVKIDEKYEVATREGAVKSYDVPDMRVEYAFASMCIYCTEPVEVEVKCKNCKYCKRLYVPVKPNYDHARNVRDRYVCTYSDEYVGYLGDNEGQCDCFEEVENGK